jgi:hypothetical protein
MKYTLKYHSKYHPKRLSIISNKRAYDEAAPFTQQGVNTFPTKEKPAKLKNKL